MKYGTATHPLQKCVYLLQTEEERPSTHEIITFHLNTGPDRTWGRTHDRTTLYVNVLLHLLTVCKTTYCFPEYNCSY